MDIEILKIASDTTYTKKISNFSHSAKKKNPMCGDIINIKINLKKGKIKNINYETKSCIYCQASASIISKYFINKKINTIYKVLVLIEKYYYGQTLSTNQILDKIFNKKNLKRKECLYLPVKTFAAALKLKKNFNQL